ncbi:hypothetical protein KR222_001292, partial [Zaprionus bogoriensis]
YKNVVRKLGAHTRPEFNLLILGLDNAGKSSLARRLTSDNEESLKLINPTDGVEEMHIQIKNVKLCLRDLSGQWRMRRMWHTYYPNTHALIYVVDSSDASRLAEAQCELCDVLLDERMANVPLLVLANKQDLSGALSSSLLVDLMGLKRLEGRPWQILDCSAINNAGIYVRSL